MILASKICGIVALLCLAALLTSSLESPEWLGAAFLGGCLVSAAGGFLLYGYARRHGAPKSKLAVSLPVAAVVVLLLCFVLPFFG
jgi:hypothetical protein